MESGGFSFFNVFSVVLPLRRTWAAAYRQRSGQWYLEVLACVGNAWKAFKWKDVSLDLGFKKNWRDSFECILIFQGEIKQNETTQMHIVTTKMTNIHLHWGGMKPRCCLTAFLSLEKTNNWIRLWYIYIYIYMCISLTSTFRFSNLYPYPSLYLIFISLYLYIFISLYFYIFISLYFYINISLYLYIFIPLISLYLYIFISLYLYISISLSLYLYISISLCLYI